MIRTILLPFSLVDLLLAATPVRADNIDPRKIEAEHKAVAAVGSLRVHVT